MENTLQIIGALGFVTGVAIIFALVVYFAFSALSGFRHLRAGRPDKHLNAWTFGGIGIAGGYLTVNSMKYRLIIPFKSINPDARAAFNSALARMLANRTPHPNETCETFVQVSSVSGKLRKVKEKALGLMAVMYLICAIALLIFLLGGFNPSKVYVIGLQIAILAQIVLGRTLSFNGMLATRWSCSSGVLRLVGKKSRERSLPLYEISKMDFLLAPDGFVLHLDLRGGLSSMDITSAATLDNLLPLYDCIVRHRPELKFQYKPDHHA